MTPQALLLGLSGGLFMLLSLSALITVTLLEDFEFDYDRVPIGLTHSRYPHRLLGPTPQVAKGGPVKGIFLSKILFDKLLDVPPSARSDNFSSQVDDTPFMLDDLPTSARVYLAFTPPGVPSGKHALCQNPKEAVWTLGVLRDDPPDNWQVSSYAPWKQVKRRHEPPSGIFARYVRLADAFFASYDSPDVTVDGDWTACYQDTLEGEILTSAQTPEGNWVVVAYSVPQLDGQARQMMLRLYRFAGGSSSAPLVQNIPLEGSQSVRALALSAQFPSPRFWESPVLRILVAREKDSRPFRTLTVLSNMEWQVSEAATYGEMRLRLLALFPLEYAGEQLVLTVQQYADRSSFTIDVFSLFPPSSLLTCPLNPLDTNHTQESLWTLKFNVGIRKYAKQALTDESSWKLAVAESVSREAFAIASVPYVIGMDRDVEPRLVEILNLPGKSYFRQVAISNDGNLIALLDNHNDLLLLEREALAWETTLRDKSADVEVPRGQWQVAMELPLSPPLRSLTVLRMLLHAPGSSTPSLILVFEGGVLACLDISPRYRPPAEEAADFLSWAVV